MICKENSPVNFTSTIIIAFGIIILVAGIVSIVNYFRTPVVEAVISKDLARGLVEILVGIFFISNVGWIMATFPILAIIYGVVTLILGIHKVQLTVDMIRLKVRKWGFMAVSAILTIICAVIIIFNPFSTTAVLWIFVGVSLIVEAIVDIIATLFAPKNEENN